MGKGGEHLGILVLGASLTSIKGSGTFTSVTLCWFVCCDLFQLAEVSLILVHTSGHTGTILVWYVTTTHPSLVHWLKFMFDMYQDKM
jgi:hypothetical protein